MNWPMPRYFYIAIIRIERWFFRVTPSGGFPKHAAAMVVGEIELA
jgi:hypothetical protein